MRNSNPVENTGVVLHHVDNKFLGTCFIFRYPGIALTAAHVVAASQPNQLVVAFPGSRVPSMRFQVRDVYFHPTADLAALVIDPPDERSITWAVTHTFDDRGYGLDVAAFGYPEHWPDKVHIPNARFFKGYIQRFFLHSSHLGYKYLAAELSFSCPGGLSGSHILNALHQGRLYGIVTENLQTSTQLESIREVVDGGKEFRETFHNVINYGIALWLPEYNSWLDIIAPPVPQEELVRRSENQHRWNAESRS
jgi:hypothetical protein